MGTVRPLEGKSAASERPDGEIRGSKGFPITRMRDVSPSVWPLQQAPYCTSQNVASNPRSLVQKSSNNRIELDVRVSKEPWARERSYRRERYSTRATTGYPRVSCREVWRTRDNKGRGRKRRNGRTSWQITGDQSTGALDTVVWYDTQSVCEGSSSFMATWARKEKKASKNRQRKREA